ncbi:hypothetical protein SAMD00019534_104280 [Acytostelium subglobosum LB1]|uniref:hypothetical protein n=1 Tax=Acytostelium subglobosum LB1 TaxID=1410327 RepID=UPI000644E01B|nr:hypothetical protein SAMD00019534_104280 [Acytostelium subglobosum LB1]GAM27253.1 hypothetical protein SAMD00019534_104280 [Acytostelium subglobosum LB1]|eukprot:XP_012749720.1 hypothetical protein SAMD00019534_104280 [Acytostelium subglobosum LB1]
MTEKAGLFQQFYTLLYKQYLLLIRNKVLTFVRVTASLWTVLIFYIILKSIHSSGDEVYPTTSVVFNYTTNSDYYLQYYFDPTITQPEKDQIVGDIVGYMGWKEGDILELTNGTNQIDTFTEQAMTNTNTTLATVFFSKRNATNYFYSLGYNYNDQVSKSSFIFNFQPYGYNTATRYVYAIRAAIETSLAATITGGEAKIEILNREPPSVLGGAATLPGKTVISMLFPFFLTLGLTFPFILFVYLIVEEKERKIRSYLRAFGVHDTIYYSTWLIDGILVALINTIIVMIFGYSADITFISNTNSSVIFIVLMTYQVSLIGIGLLIASLISRTKAAMILAVVIFSISIVGSILMSMMTSLVYALWSNKDKYYDWLILFQVLTPLNWIKVIVDISTVTINANFIDFNSKVVPGHYDWSNFVGNITSSYAERKITTTYNTNSYIFVATIIYMLLAWYFDKVIPDDFGGRRSPIFLFTKKFWFPNATPSPIKESDLYAMNDSQDPDIVGEGTCVTMDNFRDHSLVIRNLQKKYGKKRVVNNLSISAEKGKIVALLGHNGAGKTTTINMVTGQTTITAGQVFVHGYDVSTQMEHIRTMLGLCPQFDVYWPDFTAREHLTIMTLVKEKRDNIKEDINQILASVRLSSVGDNQVSSYSGGMRRRLSVAIGIIGEPKVVILDEPTTGIDPANRRYIWKLIKSIKKDKLILLTTHSMEEADALGDKILIMDQGQLSGCGTSLHLKDRYGSGYKLHLITTDLEKTQEFVRSHLPDAALDRINSMNIIYTIPTMDQNFSNFLKLLATNTNNIEALITDWQIQNTTLEDVFLHLVRKQEHS